MRNYAQLNPKPCVKSALCPAGVSFLEEKDDIFEDWREKFFNTWKVRLPGRRTDGHPAGESHLPLTPLRAHDQINLDCAAAAAFAQWPGCMEQPG